MGHARCTFTCLISSITSERPEVLYSFVSTYQQHVRQEDRRRQEAHSHHPCHHDFPRSWRGCRWLQWYCVAMSQQRQPQYVDEAFTDCDLPTPPSPTPLWGPGSNPDNWWDVCGFLKPPGSDRFWKVTAHARCILHPTKNTRLETDWSKLPSWNMALSWLCRLEEHLVQARRPWSAHFPPRTSCRLFIRDSKKRRISEVMSDHSLIVVIVRPFAHYVLSLVWETCTSSRSDHDDFSAVELN